MIDDILDFSSIRFENRRIRLIEQKCMDSLIRQILAEFELLHHRKLLANISLSAKIHCDQHKVGRVFANLIGNAIKHGNPNEDIKINAFIRNENFIFSVTNEVMNSESLDFTDLFEPFVRGTNSKGLGLGLFITREIVKMHKGKIVVDLKGSKITFKMIIPIDAL